MTKNLNAEFVIKRIEIRHKVIKNYSTTLAKNREKEEIIPHMYDVN